MRRLFLVNANDLEDNSVRGIELGGRGYLVIKVGGKVYVYEDRCSHQNMPISENCELEGDRIICLWHGAEFDVRTGRNLSMPAPAPIKKIPTEFEENGNIFVILGKDN